MAVLRWTVPIGQNEWHKTESVTFPNRFHTEYDRESPDDETRFYPDPETEDLTGRYPIGLYYVFSLRNSKEHSETEVALLNRYCDELNRYVRASRKVVRAFDSLWSEYRNSLDAIREYRFRDHQELPDFFNRLGEAIREHNGGGNGYDPVRVASALQERYQYALGDGFPGAVENIWTALQSGNRGRARSLYRELHLQLTNPYRQMFESILRVVGFHNRRMRYEHRYQILFDDERSLRIAFDYELSLDTLFGYEHDRLVYFLEKTFRDALPDEQLSNDAVSKSIDGLRRALNEISFPDGAKNIYKIYFDDSVPPGGDPNGGRGACVALLAPIDPITGQESAGVVVAFSGCRDGEPAISDFFGFTCNKPFRDGFQSVVDRLSDYGHEVATITYDVEYFTGGAKPAKSVKLRDVMVCARPVGRGSKTGVRRMFSCCERKLLAYAVAKNHHVSPPCDEGKIYIERGTCEICHDGIEEFRASGRFNCIIDNPAYDIAVHNESRGIFDAFAAKVINCRSKTPTLTFP